MVTARSTGVSWAGKLIHNMTISGLTILKGLDAFSKNEVRSYGHIQLCGVLYTCWQTEDGVDGRYMICLLYKDVICLASASKVEQIYTIQACINLHQTRIETVDNGRGEL